MGLFSSSSSSDRKTKRSTSSRPEVEASSPLPRPQPPGLSSSSNSRVPPSSSSSRLQASTPSSSTRPQVKEPSSSSISNAAGSSLPALGGNYLGGLRVLLDPDQPGPAPTIVKPESAHFKAVAAIINLGLSMLESDVGQAEIVEIGTGVITWRYENEHIYRDKPENMGFWVKKFLANLRADFVTVVISHQAQGEAHFMKTNWAEGGKSMKDWRPSMAGTMKLNRTIMENLIQAGVNSARQLGVEETRTYESLVFLMSVTIAHELMHAFVGFLHGRIHPHTPPEVTFLSETYNTRLPTGGRIGESGRAWEGAVFGGTIEAYEVKKHPLGDRQAGLFYIIDEDNNGRLLDRGSLQRCLEFNFDFPLKTRGGPWKFPEIESKFRHMSEIHRTKIPRVIRDLRHRMPTTVSPTTLMAYNRFPSHTIRDRQFSAIRAIPRHPGYLFASG